MAAGVDVVGSNGDTLVGNVPYMLGFSHPWPHLRGRTGAGALGKTPPCTACRLGTGGIGRMERDLIDNQATQTLYLPCSLKTAGEAAVVHGGSWS